MQNDGLPVEAAAVCDVYKMNIERAVDQVNKALKTKPATFGDYREVIDADKFDVLCTATPDHWHAKITIDALEAGKSVPSSDAYASRWEAMSKERSAPNHIPGWDPYNKDPMFSRQVPKDYQSLEGPWKDDNTDPAAE